MYLSIISFLIPNPLRASSLVRQLHDYRFFLYIFLEIISTEVQLSSISVRHNRIEGMIEK